MHEYDEPDKSENITMNGLDEPDKSENITMYGFDRPDKKERKKKVLMLASVASMIDQFNIPNIRLLQEMGYEVHVACNFKAGNTCDAKRLRELKKLFAVMHVIWHLWDCPRDITSVRACGKAYMQLGMLMKRYSFAWMHCHSPVGAALARIAARQWGIRIAYTAHGFHFYQGAPAKNWLLYYPAEKILAHWTDVLITVNQEDYCFARKKLKAGQVFYIPGIGVDVGKYAPGQKRESNQNQEFCRKFGIPPNAKVLLSAGELIPRKNHRMAIAALAALGRQDVYYLVCGQGPLHGELVRYADSLGVGAYLRMPGYQETMPWVYQNADIFVFPSVQEGMPVALMEAMASGLPCVVSDIRGSRELIRDSERFSLQRPGELLHLLQRMLDERPYRKECGAYNQKHIKQYSCTVVEARMRKIYEVFC